MKSEIWLVAMTGMIAGAMLGISMNLGRIATALELLAKR